MTFLEWRKRMTIVIMMNSGPLWNSSAQTVINHPTVKIKSQGSQLACSPLSPQADVIFPVHEDVGIDVAKTLI
jgi:hypothetical protein